MLKGKVAVVTGGGRDVGRAIALALAGEGASVAVNYRHSAEEAEAVVREITAAGGRAVAVQADVTDYPAVQAMMRRVAEEMGGIDILVNNAGIALRQRFLETGPTEWKSQIDACLYGAIHCCHAAGPMIEARKNGRIISLVGDSSRVGESGLAIVAAARGGTIALMKSLAREMGRSGTTCNTVSLGLIETQHSDKAWLEANREKLVKLYSIRRLGTPEDVAPTVLHLASPGAAWVTGQVISVSGGFSMVG
ncbi:SDR family NAD(P)-dependent oxidoreductase [Sabulicella rubraurantiaca]|uniref:SDR family NAD(P)-dependent oxidoreductase n=1 Tax=Sabulicella rubraurantiaca TaxID=2811429 RepID=UPI001A95D940|nr:SDR family oxidoreductase [Sabulicella rubraurantiaca]